MSIDEFRILEATQYEWAPAHLIEHHVITVSAVDHTKYLKFAAPKQSTPKGAAADVCDMAKIAISLAGQPIEDRFMDSPLDIPLGQPCWLLIRLDPAVNWQFAVGKVPCTLKEEDLRGDNIMLRHVYADGIKGLEGAVQFDGCQTIFLGVVHRLGSDQTTSPNPGRCRMNLNIEFFQTSDDGRDLRLPLIVDPDVPNDGGQAYP